MAGQWNDPPDDGFRSPNYTPIPNDLFDRWLSILSFSELKVLLYVMRRTLGFHRVSDDISAAQIARGITKRDGTRLDRGTGLGEPAIRTALRRLTELGLINTVENWTAWGSRAPSTYTIRWHADDTEWIDALKDDHSADRGGESKNTGGGSMSDPPGSHRNP